jgi:hypothetical protein
MEQAIRERAYHMWLEAGRPEGMRRVIAAQREAWSHPWEASPE